MSTQDERLVITAEEAESLLHDGDTIHNLSNSSFVVIGCDWTREQVIETFRRAHEIEIGGPACKAMRHPILVREPSGRSSFFEADMAKVEAFEAARLAPRTTP